MFYFTSSVSLCIGIRILYSIGRHSGLFSILPSPLDSFVIVESLILGKQNARNMSCMTTADSAFSPEDIVLQDTRQPGKTIFTYIIYHLILRNPRVYMINNDDDDDDVGDDDDGGGDDDEDGYDDYGDDDDGDDGGDGNDGDGNDVDADYGDGEDGDDWDDGGDDDDDDDYYYGDDDDDDEYDDDDGDGDNFLHVSKHSTAAPTSKHD